MARCYVSSALSELELMDIQFKYSYRLSVYDQVLLHADDLVEAICNLKCDWYYYLSRIDWGVLLNRFVKLCDRLHLPRNMYDTSRAIDKICDEWKRELIVEVASNIVCGVLNNSSKTYVVRWNATIDNVEIRYNNDT